MRKFLAQLVASQSPKKFETQITTAEMAGRGLGPRPTHCLKERLRSLLLVNSPD